MQSTLPMRETRATLTTRFLTGLLILTTLVPLISLNAAESPAVTADPVLSIWANKRVNARPGLPAPETRSRIVHGVPDDPVKATCELAAQHVPGFPQSPEPSMTVQATAAAQEAEEIVELIAFEKADGSSHAFAAYFRPDDSRPFFWQACNYQPRAATSFEEATGALVKRILGGQTDGLRILGYTNVVDTTSAQLLQADGTAIPSPWARAWVFFVDDRPTHNWEHPCRYVVFSEDLSSFVVQYARQPMRVVLAALPDRPDLRPTVIRDVPLPEVERVANLVGGPQVNAINYAGSAQNCYAVIISGGIEARQNYIRYSEDSAFIYSTLTKKYGFADSHIYALVSDGTDPDDDRNESRYNTPVYSNTPTDLDNDGDVDIDGPCTLAEVQAAFDELATIVDGNDQVFVFVTDHGSQESGWDALICLWGENMRDDQLADMTADLPCPVFFALETCYSGGFIDDITPTANRVIGAACEYDDTSEGWAHFDPWVYYLTASFRGYYAPSTATGANPWNDGAVCDVDGNGDNRISFQEAYDHAWNNKPASDIPQLGENPAGLADSLYMHHFHVALNNDTPRSSSIQPQDYSYIVRNYDWACVAIAPSVTGNIAGDNNRNMSSPFHNSTYSGTTRDFIMIDGHDLGEHDDYYARVSAGSGSYAIEAVWEAVDLTLGVSEPAHNGVGEVMDLFEVYLTAGESYQVDLDITGGAGDLAMFLYRPGQSLEERSTAHQTINSAGGGGDEQYAFVAPETGWYGIVVTDESGSWANAFISVDIATPLAAPTGVTATDGTYNDRITVNWNSVAGATRYRVYRSTVNNSSSATALTGWITPATYNDYSATVGRTYYYWVKAAADTLGLKESAFGTGNGGYVDTISLSSDGKVTASSDPSYYDVYEANSSWWAIGVRADNPADNWSLRVFSSPGFTAELKTSTYNTEVDFVVCDGNHLPLFRRGVQAYRYSGSGTAAVEYEGYTETLGLGSTAHSWPAGDVVEIWDVDLDPGTYRFTMSYTSGSADLDFALFGSQGGTWVFNRQGFLARSSSGSGGVEESFTYTVSSSDTYGLCVWANDAQAAGISIVIETLTAGLWEGDVSDDWHTAGNWNDGQVPSSTVDVTIPGGCPHDPVISTASGACKNLTIQSSASLTLNNKPLQVDNDVTIHGHLALGTLTFANLQVGGDIRWEQGSTANMTGSAEMYIAGDWTFNTGADVQFTGGYIEFSGTGHSWIRCHDADCRFYNVRSDKSGGGEMRFSFVSSAPVRIENLYAYSQTRTIGYNSQGVVIEGVFNNMGGFFDFATDYNGIYRPCPLIYSDNGGGSLKPTLGSRLYSLRLESTSQLSLTDIYDSTLVVTDDIVLNSGQLEADGVNIEIGGDWSNGVGAAGFVCGTNTVSLVGTGNDQNLWGSSTFCKLNDERGAAGRLVIAGPTTVTDTYTATHTNEVLAPLSVAGTLNLNAPDCVLNVQTGVAVSAANLDLGGQINCYGGTIIAGDVVDTAIVGGIHITGGELELSQGTTSSQLLSLGCTLTIEGGTVRMRGGNPNTQSWWPNFGDCVLTMSGGVLDFTDTSINLRPDGTYTFLHTISGGRIRTAEGFIGTRDDFLPAGGVIELYGADSGDLAMGTGTRLHDLEINKTGSAQVNALNDVFVDGDMRILGGELTAPALIEVGGNWTNGVGDAGFNQGTGTVCFCGSGPSDLQSDETFNHLEVNKTYGSYTDLELMGVTAHIQGDLDLVEGTLEMNPLSILDVDGSIDIASGAGLNANDKNTEVRVGGDWNNQNTLSSIFVGFSAGYNSLTVFDGTGVVAHLSTATTNETFDRLTIDRPGGGIRGYNGLTARDDVVVKNGYFNEWGVLLVHYFAGDLIIDTGGRWYDQSATLVFNGIAVQTFDNKPDADYIRHLVVEKNTGITFFPLQLGSNLRLLNGGSVTVREGQLVLNGHYIRCTGNVTIEDGGACYVDAGGSLEVGPDTLEIQSGGLLSAIGATGNPATVTDWSGDYAFIVRSGAEIEAQNAIFEGMDVNGIQIQSGAQVTEPHTFHGCTFRYGAPGGTYLAMQNNQNITVRNAVFPHNPGSGAYNVTKTIPNGQVNFVHATGGFAGEAFDNDPNNRINWHSGILNSAVLDIPGVATMGGSYDLSVSASGDTPLTPITYAWTVEDLPPATHTHGAMTDGLSGCQWLSEGSKTVTVVVSNELGSVQSQQTIEVQPLTVEITGVQPVSGSNAVHFAIGGTSADSVYRVEFRDNLSTGNWQTATPGGDAVPGSDGTTFWIDQGGPGRDLNALHAGYYRVLLP